VAVLAAVLIGEGRPRAAGGAIVILVRPPAAPPTVTEALVHLRGELDAAGFAAQIVEAPVGPDVRSSLERVSPATDAVAVVAVLPVADDHSLATPEVAAAEMWVIDRLTGKTIVRRASAATDRERAAEILSVRAVELLRASFVELAIMAEQPPAVAAPQAQTATRWADRAIEEHQRAWSYGLELGGSVLQSFGGVGPSLLPLIRLERAFGDSFLARLSGAGLGAPARVSTAGGPADVTQTLLLGEVAFRLRAGRRIQPLLTAGAGALRFSAAGPAATSTFSTASGTRWVGVLDVGAGTHVSIGRRLELGLEVHALLAEPYPTVRFDGSEIARAGRPSLMAGVTVLGGL
jgi:hypothetical protein